MASLREMALVVSFVREISKNRTTKAVEINNKMGISFLTVSFLTLIGQMRAPIPISRRTFKMLLPMTLPSSISVVPLIRELIEMASSGALVPKATMVRPIKSLETLKLVAMEEEPETNQSAPRIKKTKPRMRRMICNIISMFILI